MLVNKYRYLFIFFFFFTNKPLSKFDICLKKKNSNICPFFVWLYGLSLLFVFLCRINYLLKISFGVKFPLTGYHSHERLSFKIESEFSKDGGVKLMFYTIQ